MKMSDFYTEELKNMCPAPKHELHTVEEIVSMYDDGVAWTILKDYQEVGDRRTDIEHALHDYAQEIKRLEQEVKKWESLMQAKAQAQEEAKTNHGDLPQEVKQAQSRNNRQKSPTKLQ